MTVLDPYMAVLFREWDLHHGILYEDTRMGLTVQVHDLPLVVDQILESHRRGDHLPRRAEMIELPTCQRKDSHLQTGNLGIRLRWVCT